MALGQRSPPTQRLLGSAWALEAWAEVKEMDTHPLGGFFGVFGWGFLASQSHSVSEAFAGEPWLRYTHRSHFMGGEVT